MNLRRPFQRRLTSTFMVVSLLFAQLALANYVCPGAGSGSMSDMMAAPCAGMDMAAPVLCHQYAADSAQSFEAAKLATPTQPILVQLLVLPIVPDSARALAMPVGNDRPEIRPPPDPIFLQTLRLRV